MSEGEKRWVSQLKQRDRTHPPSTFFVLIRASTDRMMPIDIGEEAFTQSTDSHANIFWRHSHRRTQK